MTDDDRDEPLTITVPVPVELDAVHAPAWEHVLVAMPDEETAREQLGEAIAQTADIDGVIYRLHRQIEQQQQQAAAQMQQMMGGNGGGGGQATATDGGDGGESEDPPNGES